jgi:hypothetical protein
MALLLCANLVGCTIKFGPEYWDILINDTNSTWVSSDNHIWFSIVDRGTGDEKIINVRGQSNYGGSIIDISIASGGSEKFPKSFYIFPLDSSMLDISDTLLIGDITSMASAQDSFVVGKIDVDKYSSDAINELTFTKVSSPPSWKTSN